MLRSCTAFTISICLAGGPALAGNSFVLGDHVSRAPAVTLHCAGSGQLAVPCGTAATPLIVAPVTGGATAANQTTEISTQQSMYVTLGTQADGAYTGGSGSMISLLKAVISALSAGTPALTIGGQPISRSISLASSQSFQLFPANSMRHYLGFQVPSTTSLWVNFVGGAASANGTDCILLPAGTVYESGQYVIRGPISVYSPMATAISAWEG